MKRSIVAAAICTTLMAGTAAAQGYVGGGGGSVKTDNQETSWKLYGGYQFNPTWGLEAAYNDLGRYRGSNLNSWTLAGTASMPFGDKWSLLGKLGAAFNRPRFAGSSNRTDLLLGVGLGYSFTPHVGVRLEYEDFGKVSKAGNGGDSRGRNLGLSVKYSF